MFGIAADSGGTTGGVNVEIFESGANGNTQLAFWPQAAARELASWFTHSTVNLNTTGIAATGAGATVRVGSSSITGNNTAHQRRSGPVLPEQPAQRQRGGEAFGGPVPGGLK